MADDSRLCDGRVWSCQKDYGLMDIIMIMITGAGMVVMTMVDGGDDCG